MILALVALLVVQATPPEVTVSVDRTRLRVGEELRFTLQTRTYSSEPMQIRQQPLSGFAIVASREFTEVAISGAGGPVRTSVRELLLRPERAGTLLIHPVSATQGSTTVSSAAIKVVVDSATAGGETGISPLAHGLLEAARPPRRNDQVAIRVIVPAETVFVGQQLDVIVAAWFPREMKSRLRRAPVLSLPTPEGVWAYPQVAPPGVAATRQVRGGMAGSQWMDLYVLHQVVFPLAAGRVVIPPASVEYALPVTFSFFSREERYALQSDSAAITVMPLPAAGRSADDQGVAGRRITLDVTVTPAEARVGEPLEVAATLHGIGNVQLWPEPRLRWPAGFRAYPAQTTVELTHENGLVAGTKSFRYLVVPDSAGSLLLPEVRYPYYDIAAGGYAVARVAPRALAVAPGAEPRAARALPPLLRATPANSIDELAESIPPAGWGAFALGPPLLVLLLGRRRRNAAVPATLSAAPLSRLGRLEREFHAVLASHVPDAFARDGDRLARALRASGMDSAVADHVMRLRDRLRAARYGPRGLGDAVELAAELEQVLRVLGAEAPGRGRRRRATLVGLCLVLALARPGGGASMQAASAEALYQAGALRAAADSFAARAEREPRVPAHWYNLGATLYRAGADGKAIAAWTRAARLDPRDPVIRRARRLLPPPDAASEPLLAVGPGTPGEWWLLATTLWVACWVAAHTLRRRVVVAGLASLALVTAGLGIAEATRRARSVAVVLGAATPVRVAPYGAASPAATVEAGAAVVVTRTYGEGRWLEVRRGDGVRGWVLANEVVPL